MTSWKPSKLKAKQMAFKAKQEQALNHLLKQHQRFNELSKEKEKDQLDKGGFERWGERNQPNYVNQSYQTNRNSNAPVPPIRKSKSKLLSAAIANSKNSPSKLIPSDSPVIATISSPNSNQTLQVRSHLVVHPANQSINHRPQQQMFANHPISPISPIPFRQVLQTNKNLNYDDHHFQQQQLRHFQSAPQLPFRYGSNSTQNTNLVNGKNFLPNHNQTFHNFEPISYKPTVLQHHHSTLMRNNQIFARKTLPPSFLNSGRHPQHFNQPQPLLGAFNYHQQQLPHSSTFISSYNNSFGYNTPVNNYLIPQQFSNDVLNYDTQKPVQLESIRQRSLSAPDQMNMRRIYREEFPDYHNESYFSPIQTPFNRATANSTMSSMRRSNLITPNSTNLYLDMEQPKHTSPSMIDNNSLLVSENLIEQQQQQQHQLQTNINTIANSINSNPNIPANISSTTIHTPNAFDPSSLPSSASYHPSFISSSSANMIHSASTLKRQQLIDPINSYYYHHHVQYPKAPELLRENDLIINRTRENFNLNFNSDFASLAHPYFDNSIIENRNLPNNSLPNNLQSSSKTWLPHSPIGTDLHRIETINRMRLAQLAKQRARDEIRSRGYLSANSSCQTTPINSYPKRIKSDSYLRPIEYPLNYDPRLVDSNSRIEKQLLKKRLLDSRLPTDTSLNNSSQLDDSITYNEGSDSESQLKNSRRILSYANKPNEQRTRTKSRRMNQAVKKANRLISDSELVDLEGEADVEEGNDNYLFYKSLLDRRENLEQIERESSSSFYKLENSDINDKTMINNSSAGTPTANSIAIANLKRKKKMKKEMDEDGNQLTKVTCEEMSSSGRGSSNLDSSPKLTNNNESSLKTNDEDSDKQITDATILKSNSSSSGFASSSFAITGSPDKQQKLNKQIINKTTAGTTEVSEADENYEFDQLNSPQSNDHLDTSKLLNKLLYRQNLQNLQNYHLASNHHHRLRNHLMQNQLSSLSACTTPIHQFSDILSIQKQRRSNQFKHIDHHLRLINTPTQSFISDFDDYYDNEAADEEIRILNNNSNLDKRVFEQRNFNQLSRLNNPNNNPQLSRAVFSDSELYDNQSSNNELNYQKYWRRMRCEQLKQELNEVRRSKQSINCIIDKKPTDEYDLINQTDDRSFKAKNLETAC